MARHRNTEVLAQTYYHPVASLFSNKIEFARQVYHHMDVLWDLFHARPTTLENTEFIYSNETRFRRDAIAWTVAGGLPRHRVMRRPHLVDECPTRLSKQARNPVRRDHPRFAALRLKPAAIMPNWAPPGGRVSIPIPL